MAVPWINFLAPSMGGIGPIELDDLPRLEKLKGNGIPFYAGRFYPKDSQAILNGLQLGLFSETPPWLTWEEIRPTQIWMVPIFEDERIISMDCSVERIDLWPRLPEDNLPELPTKTSFDEDMQSEYWTKRQIDTIDPGIKIVNNVLPPIFALGYVGISEVKGKVTEWGFYDQQLTWINKKEYGNPINAFEAYYGIAAPITKEDDYSEIIIARNDGIWRNQNPELPTDGPIKFETDRFGKPIGFSRIAKDDRNLYAIFDDEKKDKFGSDAWDVATQPTGSRPRVGSFLELKSSRLDTIVITIKVSCQTIVIPDDPIPADSWATLSTYGAVALETLGSNLSNNIWYFYLPVRYDGRYLGDRYEYLLGRAGINKIDNENYSFSPYTGY
jgi:hypothetical protein